MPIQFTQVNFWKIVAVAKVKQRKSYSYDAIGHSCRNVGKRVKKTLTMMYSLSRQAIIHFTQIRTLRKILLSRCILKSGQADVAIPTVKVLPSIAKTFKNPA